MHQVLGLARSISVLRQRTRTVRQSGDQPHCVGRPHLDNFRLQFPPARISRLRRSSMGACTDPAKATTKTAAAGLFCLDAQYPDRVLWSKATASHVESTPTVDGSRIYFGRRRRRPPAAWIALKMHSGSDGLRCPRPSGTSPATTSIRLPRSPAAGCSPAAYSGNIHQKICAPSRRCRHQATCPWKSAAPVPLAPARRRPATDEFSSRWATASSAKMPTRPDGRVWCLSAADGKRQWEFRSASSILGSPVVSEELVFCAIAATTAATPSKRGQGDRSPGSRISASRSSQRRSSQASRVFVLTIGGSRCSRQPMPNSGMHLARNRRHPH